MTKEILCVHKPYPLTYADDCPKDGGIERKWFQAYRCARCHEGWAEGGPIPEVVIGVIR